MLTEDSQKLSGNKRIAKNTIMLYLRMGLSMAISLYTSRIVIRELGIDDFGLYNVIAGAVVMLAFVNGALAVSTQRYLSFEIGKSENGQVGVVFNQAIIIHIVFSLVIAFLAETLGLWFLNNKMVIPAGSESEAFFVYQFSVCSVILSVIQVPFTSMIMAKENMSVYAYIGFLEVIIKLAIAFVIGIYHTNRVVWYAGFIFGATLINFLIYVFYCSVKFKEGRLNLKVDSKILRSFSGFAGWSLFGAVAWTGKNQGLNIILNMFFGTAINAAYGVTNQVNNALNSFVQNFSVAVAPQIVKSYSSEDFIRMNQLLIFGSKISFLLLFVLVLPIAACIEPLLNIWLVEVPPDTSVFIRLLFCVSLLESFTYAIGNAIQATGKIKFYQILIGCTIIANLPVSWLLLKAGFQAPIVFIVSISIALITLMERIWIMNRLIPFFSVKKYLEKSIYPCIPLLLLGILIVCISIELNIGDNLLLFCIAPSLLILGTSMAYLIGLDKFEKKRIVYPIKQKIYNFFKT